MTGVEKIKLLRQALQKNEGVLRLAPAWVPRSFLIPGNRLKLDTRDIYALGIDRGGIDNGLLLALMQTMGQERLKMRV